MEAISTLLTHCPHSPSRVPRASLHRRRRLACFRLSLFRSCSCWFFMFISSCVFFFFLVESSSLVLVKVGAPIYHHGASHLCEKGIDRRVKKSFLLPWLQ
ncbi:hypothetical protein DAI22_06g253800 [Oryza sativa Japonica Group]|nr:hypothetical protein DAI22_06g253800 [Oryza sativa Japonica Group]